MKLLAHKIHGFGFTIDDDTLLKVVASMHIPTCNEYLLCILFYWLLITNEANYISYLLAFGFSLLANVMLCKSLFPFCGFSEKFWSLDEEWFLILMSLAIYQFFPLIDLMIWRISYDPSPFKNHEGILYYPLKSSVFSPFTIGL